MNLLRLFRPSPAVIQNCSSSLFVENKTKKLAPAVIQTSSSSSNFFTKCTVAFHFWKATVHFVKLKNQFLSLLAPPLQLIFLPNFSLSPLISSKNLSLLLICSLFSLCSFGGWFFSGWACRRGLGSSVVVGLAGVGLVLRWLGLPAWAWGCCARSLPVWRSPIRADLGLASPSSPNEFDFAKKRSPECVWLVTGIRFCKERVTGTRWPVLAVCLVGCWN